MGLLEISHMDRAQQTKNKSNYMCLLQVADQTLYKAYKTVKRVYASLCAPSTHAKANITLGQSITASVY